MRRIDVGLEILWRSAKSSWAQLLFLRGPPAVAMSAKRPSLNPFEAEEDAEAPAAPYVAGV